MINSHNPKVVSSSLTHATRFIKNCAVLDYKIMNVIGKYIFIGDSVNNNLKKGEIYYRVEPEYEFRIVDNSGEDYLYIDEN